MGIEDRELVGLFFARACELAGSEDNLAKLVSPWAKPPGAEPYKRQAVNAWIIGRNNPPAFLLFALARHYGLSLDEFLLGAEERRTLQEQLREARTHLAAVEAAVNRLLAVAGQRPLDFAVGAERDAS